MPSFRWWCSLSKFSVLGNCSGSGEFCLNTLQFLIKTFALPWGGRATETFLLVLKWWGCQQVLGMAGRSVRDVSARAPYWFSKGWCLLGILVECGGCWDRRPKADLLPLCTISARTRVCHCVDITPKLCGRGHVAAFVLPWHLEFIFCHLHTVTCTLCFLLPRCSG